MTVAEEFTKVAKKFAETHTKSPSTIRTFVSLLSGKIILDAGCGPGRDLKFFLDKGLKPIGIDISNGMLGEAKLLVPRAELRNMDLRELDFPSESFDGVWASASIFFLKPQDAKNALREMLRVLKPNGLLFVNAKQGRKEGTIKTTLGVAIYQKRYSVKSLSDLVESVGFHIINAYSADDDAGRDQKWVDVFARKP